MDGIWTQYMDFIMNSKNMYYMVKFRITIKIFTPDDNTRNMKAITMMNKNDKIFLCKLIS